MKKTFQSVLDDIQEHLIGKTLHGISSNASVFAITKVDYDSSNVVLDVQGHRKTWTFERMERVWNEMYYRPAANVETVFQGSGSSRNQVETIYASLSYVEWLYVNSKKCVAYIGEESHPYGEIKRMAEEKEASYQAMMNSPDPRNPLLEPDESTSPEQENEYKDAADELQQYALEGGFQPQASKDVILEAMKEFCSRFSPERLEALADDELLSVLFYTVGDNSNSLCCWLEMNKLCRTLFGSIAGGSAFKFGLFQKKETGVWTTGSPQKPLELSEEEALVEGRKIRDALVFGAKLIQGSTLKTLAAYEQLDADLKSGIGEQYYNMAWFHKYYSLICPDKLSGFHSSDWQYHVLRALKIHPSEKYYARSGQIALVQNYANWHYREFFDVVYERFGNPIQFVRLGSSDDRKCYAGEWSRRSVVGIGWSNIGSLSDYVVGEGIDKKEIQEKLRSVYYSGNADDKVASRKAGELARFYRTDESTVFVIMDGEKLLALADGLGDYFYDSTTPMSHMKPAKWKHVFTPDEKLPEKAEGKMTSCYPLSIEDNLLFLYDKYYYGKEQPIDVTDTHEESLCSNEAVQAIRFKTGYPSVYERNRIVFGAPGTGKSYLIKKDCEQLLKDSTGDYERVTFHPDYTYSQFVGSYKPVTDGTGAIKYEFVPGPFMRVYVDALISGRTDSPQPFVLIIEEINRAKVAAVFGEVFQLLDRDEDGVSEYDIHASEDVKKYLALKLGGTPDLYRRIRIPDNMFIWATMNSADQGVFPMDTAFKRRWNFEYLGIDDNDTDIHGKVVVGQDSQNTFDWNTLRKAINDKLATEYRVNEDKLMGPFFLSKKILSTVSEKDDTISDMPRFLEAFKSKVIMYLYEDAAKQHKHKLFSGCPDTTKYSAVCDSFDTLGMGIFGEDFEEVYYKPKEG